MRREFPPGANPRALTDIRRAPTACESWSFRTPGHLDDSQAGTAERLVWKPKVTQGRPSGFQVSSLSHSPLDAFKGHRPGL